MKRRFVLFLASALAVVMHYCTPTGSDPQAGTGTQTGNPGAVAGILYQPSGIPAAGISVAIRPRNTFADTSGAGLTKRLTDRTIVVTDKSGRFVFDSTLEIGTYVIEAASGNNAVLIDSVAVQNPDTTLELPPDTLKPAGAIKGVARLSEGGDPRKVFILALGIDRFAVADSLGRFRFQNLAEAVYDLRIVSLLPDYGVLDTVGVRVISGDTTDLDTVDLSFIGIPTVKGLSLSYDTLKQIVTLTWNRADTTQVSGYNVYRSDAGQNFGLITPTPLDKADTVYQDTVLEGTVYEYRVVARTIAGEESHMVDLVEDTVDAVSAFVLIKTIDSSDGLNQPSELLYDSRSNQILVLDYEYGSNTSKVLIFDTAGVLKGEITESSLGVQNLAFADMALGPDNSVILYSSYNIHQDFVVLSTLSGSRIGEPYYLDSLRNTLGTADIGSFGGVETDSLFRIWFLSEFMDERFGRLVSFDTTGVVYTVWGSDSLAGMTGMDHAVHIDKKTNTIYIAKGGSLAVFDIEGMLLGKIDVGSSVQAIYVDNAGILYVLSGNRTKLFNAQREYIGRFGVGGDLPSQFGNAVSLVVDDAGRIYISDKELNQIKVFARR